MFLNLNIKSNTMLAYEERNRKIGLTTSIIIHLLLLIFFLLYKAWPFDPPLAPQIGIEVNFGTTDVGSGDVQNESEAGENIEESEEITESETENVEETPIETSENVEAVEESSEVLESEVESFEENTTETVTPTQEETVEEETETQEEEVVNDNLMMGSNSSNNNNGDNENEVGDKGDENGNINSNNLMGTQGGGDGASLNMNGWQWDNLPNKKDKSPETGKITFKITVDEDGIIERVEVISSSVSIPVQNFYRDLLYKEARLKKISNYRGSTSSTGLVEWHIKSK